MSDSSWLDDNFEHVGGENDAQLSDTRDEAAAQHDGPERLVVPTTENEPRHKEAAHEMTDDLNGVYSGVKEAVAHKDTQVVGNEAKKGKGEGSLHFAECALLVSVTRIVA